MANKEIEKVLIDSEAAQQAMNDRGLSVRKVAAMIGRSEKSLRRYLNEGRMPASIVKDFQDAINTQVEWPTEEPQEDPTINMEAQAFVQRINIRAEQLQRHGFDPMLILQEMNKALTAQHPNMIDDEFEVVQVTHNEVWFKQWGHIIVK